MSSIAIWHLPRPNGSKETVPIELHLNLWKVPKKHKSFRRFLDIGFKLENTNHIDTLRVFVPFIISKRDVSDLGVKLVYYSTLLCAVFNENYKVTSDPQSKFAAVTNSSNEHLFDVYTLSISESSSEVTVSSQHGGTRIDIALPQTNNATYFRFRLEGKLADSIVTLKSPSN